MRPLDLSKALLRCGLLVFTVNSARAQKVSSAKGSSKGSMPPSDIPSSYPSLMPSQVPSARPSSSPSQEGTRKFVLCYGEKNVTSTSTVDDVEAALDEVKASMFAARTAAAGTSEEFVEKVMKFKDVTLPLKEQADLLWTSSVALGAGLVVDEYKVTQSLIQGELEATYMEFFEILEISNILYSKFGMTNSDPIFDEVMIRLSSIASAYRSFITASNGSKETALIKLRTACYERTFSPEEMFYYVYGYACGDELATGGIPKGEEARFICQTGTLGLCPGAVKKDSLLSSFMTQSLSSDAESFQNFGSLIVQTLVNLMYAQSVCPPPSGSTCSNTPDDGFTTSLHQMKLSVEEVAKNIAFARTCEIECYPDGTNCDEGSTCGFCCSEQTSMNIRDETVCGNGFCLAKGAACGPNKCGACCDKFDQGSNEGKPKSNGSVCGSCLEDSQICDFSVPTDITNSTSQCDFCCSGNYLELNENQGVCGTPALLETITLDPVTNLPEEPLFQCSDAETNKCLQRKDDDDGNCTKVELIVCDSADDMVIDACNPAIGCIQIPLDPPEDEDEDVRKLQDDEDLNDDPLIYPEELIIYEKSPPGDELKDGQLQSILKWIAAEVVQDKTPFCWKQSGGRGWGEPLSECPDGLDRIGALCYDPCPVGYDRFGFDCHQKCPTDGGWRDDGLFCRRAEKGRGIGYPWKFGDSLNDLGMFQRCENDYGDGNCETWGLVVYPKCSLSQVGGDGYYPFGCCICRPNVPDCDELGYNGGLDLSCAKKIQIGNPRPLKCSDSQEQDGLLCYPQCDQGFGGVGPVCWQYCDTDRFDCGAACAKDGGQCAIAVVDMVLAPIIMAASLATFGLASLPAKTANSVKIGGKFYKATKNAKRIKKVFDYSKKLKKVNTAAKVYKKGVVPGIATFEKYTNADGEILIAQMIFGTEPFAERTTKVIDDKLKEELSAWNYLKVINTWEEKQFVEIAEAEGWFAAKIGLTLVGLADPFGIVDTVNAYAHPTCAAVIPFPTGLPPKN